MSYTESVKLQVNNVDTIDYFAYFFLMPELVFVRNIMIYILLTKPKCDNHATFISYMNFISHLLFLVFDVNFININFQGKSIISQEKTFLY